MPSVVPAVAPVEVITPTVAPDAVIVPAAASMACGCERAAK